MFGIKKFKKWVVEQLNKIICELNGKAKREDVIFKDEYVECSKCGCLVNKSKAKRVDKLVSQQINVGNLLEILIDDPNGNKEIKTDYYCQLHAKNK